MLLIETCFINETVTETDYTASDLLKLYMYNA